MENGIEFGFLLYLYFYFCFYIFEVMIVISIIDCELVGDILFIYI